MTGAPMQNQPDSDRDWFEDFLKRWANPKRIYHGWWIVLAGAVLWGLAGFGEPHASLALLLQSGVDRPLQGLIVVSIGIIAFLLLLPGRPLVGMLADRYESRAMLLPILLLIVLSIGWLSVYGGPWPISTLSALALKLAGAVLPIALAVAAVNLFQRKYGIALAVLLTGPALAQLIPTFIFDAPVLGHAMARAVLLGDWTMAFLGLGNLLIAVSLLIGAGVMAPLLWRNPYRQSPQQNSSYLVDQEIKNPANTRDVLTSRPYVLYVGALSLQVIGISILLSAVSGVSMNLRAILPSVELFDPALIPPLLSIGGLLITGWLSDRYDRRRVVAWILAAQILSAPIIVLYAEQAGPLLLAISFGIGFGANGAANLALQVELWGRLHFGLLMGIQMSITSIFTAMLIPTTLWFLHNEIPTSAALPLAVIPLAIALALILLMKRPQSAVPNPPTAKAEPQVA